MPYYPPCPKNKNRCLGSLVENTVFKARRQRSMSKNKLSLSLVLSSHVLCVCPKSSLHYRMPESAACISKPPQKLPIIFLSFHITSPSLSRNHKPQPAMQSYQNLLLYAPIPLSLHRYTFQLSVSHHNQNPPTLLLRSSCQIRVRSPPWSMRNRKSLKSAHVWPLFLSSKSIMSSMHAAEPRLKDSVGHKTRKLLNAPYPACFSHLNYMTSGRSKIPRWTYTHPQQTLAQNLICGKSYG